MRSSPTLLVFALAGGLAACSGGGTSSVRVTARDAGDQALTAAATSAYSEIFLDVIDIQARNDGDPDAWTDLLEAPTSIDLLALQQGNLELLTIADIAPGTITEIRLVLAEGDQGHAITADGYFVPVRVPSGSTSGLKIKGSIVVPEGQDVEVPIAVDLSKALKVDKDGVLRIDPVLWLAAPAAPVDDGEGGAGGDDGAGGTDGGAGGTDDGAGGTPGTDPGPDPM
jgi:hypothetical protein